MLQVYNAFHPGLVPMVPDVLSITLLKVCSLCVFHLIYSTNHMILDIRTLYHLLVWIPWAFSWCYPKSMLLIKAYRRNQPISVMVVAVVTREIIIIFIKNFVPDIILKARVRYLFNTQNCLLKHIHLLSLFYRRGSWDLAVLRKTVFQFWW